MAKPSSGSPFQAMEEEAYHAYREWPILLVMRQKELAAHLAVPVAQPAPPEEVEAEVADTAPGSEAEGLPE
jgi:hypothetical protein